MGYLCQPSCYSKKIKLGQIGCLLSLLIAFYSLGVSGSELCHRFYQGSIKNPVSRSTPLINFGIDEINRAYFDHHQSVFVTGKKTLLNGEAIYKFEKTDFYSPWGSNYAPANNRFAVQLNPTWPILILQKRVCDFLGIRKTSTKTMLAPNAILLNRRIEELNKILVAQGYDPIVARFYDENRAKIDQKNYPTYAEMFVRRFVENVEFPIIEGEIIHDIAAHVFNIVLTKKHLAPFQARGRALLKLVDEIRSIKDPNGLSPIFRSAESREVLIRSLLRYFSLEADNFSGQTAWTMGYLLLQDHATAKEIYSTYQTYGLVYSLKNENPDPSLKDWLQVFVKATLDRVGESISAVNTPHVKTISMEKNKEQLLVLAHSTQQAELDLKTIIEKANLPSGVFDSKMLTPYHKNTATSLEDLLKRINEFQKALGSSFTWYSEPELAPNSKGFEPTGGYL